jgi:hypothetical protein
MGSEIGPHSRSGLANGLHRLGHGGTRTAKQGKDARVSILFPEAAQQHSGEEPSKASAGCWSKKQVLAGLADWLPVSGLLAALGYGARRVSGSY